MFWKKSFEFTFYLFATSYILLQSSAYNFYEKKKSNVSIFVLCLSSSLKFGDSVRYIDVNFKFRCFSAYFSQSL